MAEPIRVVDLAFVDDSRPTPAIGGFGGIGVRELPTRVYLPSSAQRAPLILLAHGFDGHPRKFSELAEHWAKAGYTVAVPRFPVSNDEFVEIAGGAFFGERVGDLSQQALDVAFVIDALFAHDVDGTSGLTGRIDRQRLGLYGLSMGSLTVWLTALGSHAIPIRALMQSDGGFPGEMEQLAAVTFPVFMAQSDAERGLFAPDVVIPQYEAIPATKYLLTLHGAGHATVAQNTPTPADLAYRVATTVFWDRHLAGRLDEPFPESIVIDGITSFAVG